MLADILSVLNAFIRITEKDGPHLSNFIVTLQDCHKEKLQEHAAELQ